MSGHTSIRIKILTLCLLISAATTSIYGVFSYRRERADILEGIDQRLTAAAYAVPSLLPADFPDRAAAGAVVTPQEHERNVRALSRYARQAGVSFLYTTMRRADSGFVYSSMSATDEELAGGTWWTYALPYEDPQPMFVEAFDSLRARSGEYTDSTGTYRSVFIPARSPNGIAYLLGADLEIAFVNQRLRQTLLQCVLIGVALFLIVFWLSLLITNRLSAPLIRLAGYTRKLVESDFTLQEPALEPAHRRGAALESVHLADAFDAMRQRLAQYLEDLKATTAAKERIESELRLASDIQNSMLPRIFPAFPNRPEFDIYASMDPAKEVGGDLYDFFMLDDRHLCFLVGDVSDKGVPAALFMMVTMSLLRTEAKRTQDPAVLLKAVNDALAAENEQLMFVTIFCAIMDIQTGELHYSNAGHNPPVLWTRSDGQARFIPMPEGMVAGPMPTTQYSTMRLQLQPEDVLLLYTDGVTEAKNPASQLYGNERLLELVGRQTDRDVTPLVRNLDADVKEHAAGAAQSDDITVLALRFRRT
jgi:sigma-B regulation protein RsbU (phosphoserine phosphatase)